MAACASTGASSSSSLQDADMGWHPLEEPLLWQGSEAEALSSDGTFAELSPTWKLLLLSDGSVTRHLQLLTDRPVQVECLEMRELPPEAQAALPAGVEQLQGPLLQRQVFLRAGGGAAGAEPPLVYATSWWNAAEAAQYLQRREQPIWVSLQGTELRRDIQRVCCGGSAFLQRAFGEPGPFWGRHYIFWHGGKALTVIYEAFSPRLQQLLGPAKPG